MTIKLWVQGKSSSSSLSLSLSPPSSSPSSLLLLLSPSRPPLVCVLTCHGPEVGVEVVDVTEAVAAQGEGVRIAAQAWREGRREGRGAVKREGW